MPEESDQCGSAPPAQAILPFSSIELQIMALQQCASALGGASNWVVARACGSAVPLVGIRTFARACSAVPRLESEPLALLPALVRCTG
eukprot:5140880-Prymnesium_polylepis.2